MRIERGAGRRLGAVGEGVALEDEMAFGRFEEVGGAVGRLRLLTRWEGGEELGREGTGRRRVDGPA